jgi:hypothetical protein
LLGFEHFEELFKSTTDALTWIQQQSTMRLAGEAFPSRLYLSISNLTPFIINFPLKIDTDIIHDDGNETKLKWMFLGGIDYRCDLFVVFLVLHFIGYS